jgi:5'-3' exonuclease
MIARLVRAREPARLVACMDEDWRPAFRVQAVPSYKAHRVAQGKGAERNDEQTPDALVPQVPIINDVLAATGLAVAGAKGYEADDVIATLAHRADCPVDVITGDRDLFQLVDDERGVRIVYTVRGLNKLDIIDEQAVADRYKIPGRAYADFAVLRGDPSDGLPGVPGVGEKTAATLINKFGTLVDLLEALDAGHGGFPAGTRNKLTAARDYLDVAPAVVRTAIDVPLPALAGDLPLTLADPDRLQQLGDRWRLGSSLSRFVAAVTGQ